MYVIIVLPFFNTLTYLIVSMTFLQHLKFINLKFKDIQYKLYCIILFLHLEFVALSCHHHCHPFYVLKGLKMRWLKTGL